MTLICGTRPDARVMAANTRPTPSIDSTPSASRAPPECHSPITGLPSRAARSMAATIRSQPPAPSAPPMTAASVQKASTDRPPILPRAVATPVASLSVRYVTEPGSSRRDRRTAGARPSSREFSAMTVNAVIRSSRRGKGKCTLTAGR